MFFTKIAASFVLVASAMAQTFSVNTPASLPQCLPAQIVVTGGTAPFILAAIPATQVTAPAIATIATFQTSPYVWTVNLPAGLNITLRVTDATGAIAYSSDRVIQAGSSNDCLNASASTSGLTTATAAITTTVTTSGTLSGTVSAPIRTSTTQLSSVITSTSTSVVGTSTSVSTTVSTSRASAAPSSSSTGWAMPTAGAGLPAIALAALGGVVAVL